MKRLLALLALAISARAQAQQLRGMVRDSIQGGPLSGAIVTLLDSAGSNSGRAISGADGRFSVKASPVMRSLRVVHIGYRPVTRAVSAASDQSIDIVMGRLAPILDAVHVRGDQICPGGAERGPAYEMLEQARAGLLATIVSRELNAADATTVTYQSNLDPDNERVVLQTKDVTRGRTSRPFVSGASPSVFARIGYMIEDNGARTYSAPDADILIDDSFSATHCFRMQASNAQHSGQVGLAFEPAKGRDTLVDVTGVIWIDAATPQLRSLDFAYTSLEPAATDAGSGGHIEFRTMSNGMSFIEWWSLRLATLERPASIARANTAAAYTALRPRRSSQRGVRLAGLVDADGIVLDAKWPDGTTWSAPRSVVTGTVVAKTTGTSIAGAIVSLVGTSDSARSDSAGHFRLEGAPGKYMLQAMDTVVAVSARQRGQLMPVELRRGSATNVRVELVPIAGAAVDICRGQSMPGGSAFVSGVISFKDGPRPAGAEVRATFEQSDDPLDTHTIMQRALLDARGAFVVCGVGKDRPIKLELMTRSERLGDTTIYMPKLAFSKNVLWSIRVPQ